MHHDPAVADPFAGTVYRALTAADDAHSLAWFLGAQGGIGYDTAAAIDALATAQRALEEACHIVVGARS